MAFALREQLAAAGGGKSGGIEARGLTAEPGRTMCENAAARIGYSGPAIAYFGAYRALRLSIADLSGADLVLTADRAQRSAAVRMLPGRQASVFTWREALMLSQLVADRIRIGTSPVPGDLPAIARALHGARGTAPIVEPSTRTRPFHFRRALGADPLSIESGHEVAADHRRVTQQTRETAIALGHLLASLTRSSPLMEPQQQSPLRRLRRSV
jgi:protein-tyrosine-phosphatase